MKTIKGFLVLTLTMLFMIALATHVSAKPIDNGHNYFDLQNTGTVWQDDAGIFWYIFLNDYYSDDSLDSVYIYGYDSSSETGLSSQEYFEPINTSFNFRKGVAEIQNSVIDIVVSFNTADGAYLKEGTRRDGNLVYNYQGPATIKGTITLSSGTYTIDGIVRDGCYVTIQESHDVIK